MTVRSFCHTVEENGACCSLILIPAWCQIFKLMKMDSYRRFVRSPLYQSCTLASVEGKLLLQSEQTGSLDNVAGRSPSTSNKVNTNKSKGETSGYV